MTDARDPRGIVNFFVRYLVLHVIFLVGLPVSYFADLALIYFFGFMGFFTFFQMLIAITKSSSRRPDRGRLSRSRGPYSPMWRCCGSWDG